MQKCFLADIKKYTIDNSINYSRLRGACFNKIKKYLRIREIRMKLKMIKHIVFTIQAHGFGQPIVSMSLQEGIWKKLISGA